SGGDGKDTFVFKFTKAGGAATIDGAANIEITDPQKGEFFVFDSGGAIKKLAKLQNFVSVSDDGTDVTVTFLHTTRAGSVHITFDGIGNGNIDSLKALNKVIKLSFV